MEKSPYKIITTKTWHTGHDYYEFEKEVEAFISSHPGWRPCGGITATEVNNGSGMEYTLAQSFYNYNT